MLRIIIATVIEIFMGIYNAISHMWHIKLHTETSSLSLS